MPDREKVIRDLETYRDRDFIREGKTVFDSDPRYRKMIINNAIAILKAQEPMKPIYNDEKYGDHLPHCGNCEKVLPNDAVYGKVNFCHYCGKKVKWE